MTNKKLPTKGWVYLDEEYKKILAHALTLSNLMEKIGKIRKKGVIAKANKIANAYVG